MAAPPLLVPPLPQPWLIPPRRGVHGLLAGAGAVATVAILLSTISAAAALLVPGTLALAALRRDRAYRNTVLVGQLGAVLLLIGATAAAVAAAGVLLAAAILAAELALPGAANDNPSMERGTRKWLLPRKDRSVTIPPGDSTFETGEYRDVQQG